jgi:hypothetical protein
MRSGGKRDFLHGIKSPLPSIRRNLAEEYVHLEIRSVKEEMPQRHRIQPFYEAAASDRILPESWRIGRGSNVPRDSVAQIIIEKLRIVAGKLLNLRCWRSTRIPEI